MPARIDVTNQKFGKLLAIKYVGNNTDGKALWLCKCDCGKEAIVASKYLRTGHTKTCGCSVNYDLIGQIFHYLTVKNLERTSKNEKLWVCECKCGKLIKVLTGNLTSGHTRSCGPCLYKEMGNRKAEDLTGYRFGRFMVLEKVDKKWLCKCECGNTKTVAAKHLKSGNIISCGCYRKENSSKPRNITLTDEERYHTRRYKGYNDWRKLVLLKDKYICQRCFSSENLQAHHIMSYHAYKELRLDVNNGITLCIQCHLLFHNKYGKKFNTKEQLEKFLRS